VKKFILNNRAQTWKYSIWMQGDRGRPMIHLFWESPMCGINSKIVSSPKLAPDTPQKIGFLHHLARFSLDFCLASVTVLLHIRESDENVACTCRARSAQQGLLHVLLDPSVLPFFVGSHFIIFLSGMVEIITSLSATGITRCSAWVHLGEYTQLYGN
jgi:hypothetical protein